MSWIRWVAPLWLGAACDDKSETFPRSSAPLGVGATEDTARPGSPSDDSSDTGPPDADDSGVPTDTGDTGAPLDSMSGPAFYPADIVHSPLTPDVLDHLASIASTHPDARDDVFMKIGASSTVSRSTLYCFAGDDVDLGTHMHLQPTLEHFLGGDAAGATPFDRVTEAALSGMSAGWAISGSPSPVDEELEALNPRFALIHYGTNDMGLGSTHLSAMPGFYDNMTALVAQLSGAGVIPVLTGISHRGDRETADRWVTTYNALIRGMAQQWQIPFIDLHLAMDPLEGHGLASDGIHLNGYSSGSCQLTEAGLAYGYNVRNLIVLEAFDRLRRGLVLDEVLDSAADTVAGSGAPEDPFTVHTLPFADSRDTRESSHRNQDIYTDCDTDSDESGPEYSYRFDTDETVAIRAVVMDSDGVDIDLHLMNRDECIARGHHSVEATLAPGSYTFVLDTWVDGDGAEQSGEYLLAVVECDAGDCD